MNNLISIIIPAYNTEKYIEECVNSVIQQHDDSIEVIVVNDGSTDKTESICKNFCSQYANIKLINIENSGVAMARNVGISYATGEYIMFIDSDDYWEENIFEKITNSIVTSPDLVCILGYKEVYPDGNYNIRKRNISFNSDSDLFEQLCEQTSAGQWSNWLFLFKKEIIDSNHIKYSEGVKKGEDAEFFYNYCKYVKSVNVADFVLYNYRVNRVGSAMFSRNPFSALSYGEMVLKHINTCEDEKDRRIATILCTNYVYLLKHMYGCKDNRIVIHINELKKAKLIDYLDPKSSAFFYIKYFGLDFFIWYSFCTMAIRQTLKKIVGK